MSTTTTTKVPQHVPASELVVGDTIGRTKADLANGGGTIIDRIEDGPKARSVYAAGATDKLIRPKHTTKVWVMRDQAEAPVRTDDTPDVPPAEASTDAQATPDLMAALKAEHDQLLAKADQGLSGKQSARLQDLRRQLGVGQSGQAAAKRRATPGRDDKHRNVASRANAIAQPAAKVTGPNIAHLIKCMSKDVRDGDPAAVLYGLAVSKAKAYATTGDRSKLGKDGLPADLKALGSKAGSSTFYGKKLVGMLLAIYEDRSGTLPAPTPKPAAKPAATKPAPKPKAKAKPAAKRSSSSSKAKAGVKPQPKATTASK